MKSLTKLFTMMTVLAVLVSCGKENSTGGGGSPSSPSTSSTVSSSGQNFSDYATMRNFYTTKSKADNLSTNTVIYHTGSLFGANSSAVDFTVNWGFAFCVGSENLFGDDSLCNGGYSNSSSQLERIIDEGEYKIVETKSAASVDYKIAVDVFNGGFEYEAKVFNNEDSIYRRMLNLDGKSVNKTHISAANVTMSNGSTLKADLVEYFFSDGSYEAYILASNIALLANPVVSLDGYYNSYGVSADVTGQLNNIGEIKVQNIRATIHRLQFDMYTGTYSATPQSNLIK